MKHFIIEKFSMKLIRTTKYNEIYENADYIMIVNKVTAHIKIKPNV